MKRLLGQEWSGGRLEKWWLHTGPEGQKQITVEFVEDVEPVFEGVKKMAQTSRLRDMRYVASIPRTVVDEVVKVNAADWGISRKDAFSELVSGRSDRAQRTLRMLSQGRDYRKLQAKHYVP